MTYALKYFSNYRKLPESLPRRDPLGPTLESRPLGEALSIPIDVIMRNIAAVDRELEFSQQSPSEIEFSDAKIPLASAYFAFARLVQNPIPNSGRLTFEPREPLPEIAANDYFDASSWTKESYPEGFTGTGICAHCRLQRWTYKPAS